MAERVGPEPGCLADPCPACEPTYEPPVEVSDFDVACYLGALLGRIQSGSSYPGDGGQLHRIKLAYERGRGLGVYGLVKDELAEARRRDLAGAAQTFIQAGAEL